MEISSNIVISLHIFEKFRWYHQGKILKALRAESTNDKVKSKVGLVVDFMSGATTPPPTLRESELEEMVHTQAPQVPLSVMRSLYLLIRWRIKTSLLITRCSFILYVNELIPNSELHGISLSNSLVKLSFFLTKKQNKKSNTDFKR